MSSFPPPSSVSRSIASPLESSSSSASYAQPDCFPTDFPRHVDYSEQSSDELPDSNILDCVEIPREAVSQASVSPPSGLMFSGSTVRHSFPSTQAAQSRFAPRPSEPIMDHLKTDTELRKCWICYDDEGESETPASLNLSEDIHKSRLDRKKWVKACRCSLVAHESCLLTWITTYQLSHATPPNASSPLVTPVYCPQCAAPYRLVQPAYPVLNLLHRLKRPYDSSLSWSALGCVILGLGVTTSSYGLWASRCFLGPVRWNRWISTGGGGLSFVKLFQLSLVGPVLILSRTRQLDSVLPFLPISLILSNISPLGYATEVIEERVPPIILESVFPPEPALTLCLIPWARVGWTWLWTKVTSFVLRREYKSLACLGLSPPPSFAVRLEADVNAPPDNGLNQNDADNRQADDIGPQPEVQAENPPPQPLGAEFVLDYTTLRGAVRIGMEALLWPGVASLAGNLLFLLSRNRPWLMTILGLRTFAHNRSPLSTWNGSRRLVWHLLSNSVGQLLDKVNGVASMFTNVTDSQDDNWSYHGMYAHGDSIEDDPVWWRNTLGGALLVLVKDVICLLEKVLRLRKISQRRILEVGKADFM